ncbi:PREDICTED: uncharacterized protein LOC106325556 isoform X2 [Brassica oleracea var. oleracea]|uniref:uncharacterized protein LOC106325556 isoform X2 n=1 Tax=Brassica oleracea var. oleracea TaxID=109376 RepID=UPI0006A70FA4|nr:PREDICTED: uncharacterized protein LOC106325556 isoform X2 [Brassica oleracea var. oleracea]
MAMKKTSKLTQTAMIKQILKRCSSLGKRQSNVYSDDENGQPLDVPKGHFVVYVGENRVRFVETQKQNKFPVKITLMVVLLMNVYPVRKVFNI